MMSGPVDGSGGGTRREFLRGAGLAAGGATLLGGRLGAGDQDPKEITDQGPDDRKPPRLRASAPIDDHLDHLGPLRELGGTWVGRGFNVVALPDFDDPAGSKTFRVKLAATVENLQFTEIGGPIPNRGAKGQKDVNLFGLSYLQRVSDATTFGALHIEPGIWLHVQPSVVPTLPATIVRQGSIPHGTSILAQGAVVPRDDGPPRFKKADPTPFDDKGPKAGVGYMMPYTSPSGLPEGADKKYVMDANLALGDAIAGQTILNTQVLDVSTVSDPSTSRGGGLLNIPFLESNAKATQFSSTFWIETVQPKDGPVFMQLQYSQTIILFFADISWPHISVATLVKQ